MRRNEIYELLHRQYDLKEMICLADITSEEKRRELNNKGYNFGYTAREWEAKFPEISAKYLFGGKSLVYPAQLIYYDSEHYIAFFTNVFGQQRLSCPEDDEKGGHQSGGQGGHSGLVQP